MATEIGTLMRTRREALNKTLREMGDFSQQALSNYERGTRLPPEKAIPALAATYEIPEDVFRQTYQRSLTQATSGPIAEDPFIRVLNSAGHGDHLVTVTQTSIVGDRADLATDIGRMIENGVSFTYVTYLPVAGVPSDQDIWESNHRTTAVTFNRLIDRIKSRGRAPTDLGQVNYLLLGNPDAYDFYFLGGPHARLLLCRNHDPDNERLEAWADHKEPNGERWWIPYDHVSADELRYWLTDRCGLALPQARLLGANSLAMKKRHIRYRSLEQFLREDSQTS